MVPIFSWSLSWLPNFSSAFFAQWMLMEPNAQVPSICGGKMAVQGFYRVTTSGWPVRSSQPRRIVHWPIPRSSKLSPPVFPRSAYILTPKLFPISWNGSTTSQQPSFKLVWKWWAAYICLQEATPTLPSAAGPSTNSPSAFLLVCSFPVSPCQPIPDWWLCVRLDGLKSVLWHSQTHFWFPLGQGGGSLHYLPNLVDFRILSCFDNPKLHNSVWGHLCFFYSQRIYFWTLLAIPWPLLGWKWRIVGLCYRVPLGHQKLTSWPNRFKSQTIILRGVLSGKTGWRSYSQCWNMKWIPVNVLCRRYIQWGVNATWPLETK